MRSRRRLTDNSENLKAMVSHFHSISFLALFFGNGRANVTGEHWQPYGIFPTGAVNLCADELPTR